MSGGLAFENPEGIKDDTPADDNQVFTLHDSYEAAQQVSYTLKENWKLVFKSSVRGLEPGAPVEIKGMVLGRVVLLICSSGKIDPICLLWL